MRLCGFSSRFQLLFPCMRQVTHALLTRPPLDRISASTDLLSFDLHVLSTPPAFILSQDQTLIKNLSRVQIWLWSLSIPFTVLGLYQTCVCYVQFEILYLEFQGCHVVNFSRFFIVELISDNFYMLSHSVFFVNNFFNFFFDVLHAFQMRIIMKSFVVVCYCLEQQLRYINTYR